MRKRKQPLYKRLYRYFFPHRSNGYKPHALRWASVALVIVGVLVVEGAYLGTTKLVFPDTGFLASVLPATLVTLTNDDRSANGVGSVSEDATLAQAAQAAADDMAAKGYFAHVSPDGKTPWYWLDQVGYKYEYAGENLAVDFTDSKDVETAWMNSPTHHANIVKPEYTKIGIGVANGTYQGKDVTFVVQFFATPAAAPAAPVAKTPTSVTAPAPVQTPVEVAATPKVPQATPVPATDVKTASPAAPEPADVLGAEAPVTAPSATGFFSGLLTSPNHAMEYFLYGLALITSFLVLVVVLVRVKVRLQYIEAIGGGFALVAFLIALAAYNGGLMSRGLLPTDNQSASVAQAF